MDKKFYNTSKFRRLTAGLGLLACFQVEWIVFSPIVAIVDVGLIMGFMAVGMLAYKKIKYKKRNQILR